MVAAIAPSKRLQAAVLLDGRPPHRIARAARVPHSTVSRWLAGKRGLTVRSFDRLADAVGLELREKSSP